MKSKSFWKQFAFELAVQFAIPLSILVGIGVVFWLCISGYATHLLVSTAALVLGVLVCIMVKDAWNNAKKAEGHIRG